MNESEKRSSSHTSRRTSLSASIESLSFTSGTVTQKLSFCHTGSCVLLLTLVLPSLYPSTRTTMNGSDLEYASIRARSPALRMHSSTSTSGVAVSRLRVSARARMRSPSCRCGGRGTGSSEHSALARCFEPLRTTFGTKLARSSISSAPCAGRSSGWPARPCSGQRSPPSGRMSSSCGMMSRPMKSSFPMKSYSHTSNVSASPPSGGGTTGMRIENLS